MNREMLILLKIVNELFEVLIDCSDDKTCQKIQSLRCELENFKESINGKR